MYKRLLSCALGAILLSGLCVQASMSATHAVRVAGAASARHSEVFVYKFSDGGIQVTVPAGWDVKGDADTVKLFPKGQSAQIAFVALGISPTDLNSDQTETLFDSLSGKAGVTDMKLDNYVD